MSPSKLQQKGNFWPQVRAMIWDKAQELYQQDEARGMSNDFTGITATKAELREGGYFHQAKLIVLRELWLESLTSNRRKGKFSKNSDKQVQSCLKPKPTLSKNLEN